MKLRIVLPVAAAILVSGPAFAQTQSIEPAPPSSGGTMMNSTGDVIVAQDPNQLLAESLIGKNVVDPAGEKVGEVSDIILEKDGRATGVVVASGGLLGVGAQEVAVSWQKVSYSAESGEVMIDMTKEQLAEVPKFKTLEDTMREQQAPANSQPEPMAPGTAPGTGTAPQ